MAWIHTVVNGDYRHVFITSTGLAPNTSDDITVFDAHVQSRADDVSSLYKDIPVDFKVIGSTTAVDAVDHIGTTSGDIYMGTTNVVANGTVDLWSVTIDYPITFREDGVEELFTAVVTGTTSAGLGLYPLGTHGNDTIYGDNRNTNSTWAEWNSLDFINAFEHPYYAISDPLSTISGSLSGTLTRDSSTIWAVGFITLTADTDFGGDVDLLKALDVSQAPDKPTFNGFKLNVGIGGTAPLDWEGPAGTAVSDLGVGNSLLNIQDTGGVVYL